MTDIAAETDRTGTSMERATRSAVRCRVPVSVVEIVASGMRWTFARAMREASAAMMMAPSILANSDRRCGLNSESRRKPPEQIESTSGPSPPTTRPPRFARRIRSRPSRSAVPGATMANAPLMAACWRVITSRSYSPPRWCTRGALSPRSHRDSRSGPPPRPPCSPGSARLRAGPPAPTRGPRLGRTRAVLPLPVDGAGW